MQHLNQPDVILDATGVLRAEEYRGAPGVAGGLHIGGGEPLEDQIGELFKPAVPAADVQHGFAKRFVISDGHMHRIDTACAQLAKDAFRPVGVLQPVDQKCHSGTPTAV